MRHYTITTRLLYVDQECESVTQHRDTARTAKLCAEFQHARQLEHGNAIAQRYGVGLDRAETVVTTWRDNVRGRVIRHLVTEGDGTL